ncbi:MAG: ABC transporter substrate-binding protein, partial [Oscillospiraceae bacterium]|nr:ABC transporter substrate-binding protein [Oscillospiraceae bacterium]
MKSSKKNWKLAKTLSAFALILAVLLGGVACSPASDDGAPTGTPAPGDVSAAEKILNIAIAAEPSTLDPNAGIGDTWMFTIGHLYEAVTRLDDVNDAVPGMALDWELSADGLTYVFTIREDNGWSDGTPATAADFEYGIKRILRHESGENWASLVFDIKNAAQVFAGELPIEEAGIKAEGNKLTITLEQPEPYFPKLLTFAPYFGVNQAFVESVG